MADRKISDLTALTTPATGDLIPIVDISEAAAADKNKSITVGELLRGAPDGTAAAPGFAFESDGGNGIYKPGTDQVAISTGGTGRLFVNSSGNVGLGGVEGTYAASVTTTGNNGFLVRTGTSSADQIYVGNISGEPAVGTLSPDPLNIVTNASTRIRITDAGLVGLGTTSPQALGHFSNTAGSAEVRITCGGSGVSGESILRFGNVNDQTMASIRFDSTSDNLSFYSTNDTRAMTIDSSQRVGIGTTSVSAKLHSSSGSSGVTPTASADELFLESSGNVGLQFGCPNTGNARISFGDPEDNQVGRILYDHATNAMQFDTAGSESIRIDSGQRLLVGTSSTSSEATVLLQGNNNGSTLDGTLRFARGTSSPTADSSLGKLDFGDSGHTSAARIQCLRDGGTWTSGSSQPTRLTFSTTADGASSPTERMRISNGGRVYINSSSVPLSLHVNNVSNDLMQGFNDGTDGSYAGTNKFLIQHDGDVRNTNNSYGAISDIKLKENIVDAPSQWDDLKALQVRKYNFKEETGHSTHTQLGVIAQEIELVSPGLVKESPDKDPEGNDLGTTTKSVNYSVLYMKAVKALQEAMERIEQLEAKVAALEA